MLKLATLDEVTSRLVGKVPNDMIVKSLESNMTESNYTLYNRLSKRPKKKKKKRLKKLKKRLKKLRIYCDQSRGIIPIDQRQRSQRKTKRKKRKKYSHQVLGSTMLLLLKSIES